MPVTAEQLKACQDLGLDPHAEYNEEQAAKAAGIDTSTLKRWRHLYKIEADTTGHTVKYKGHQVARIYLAIPK